MQKYYYSNIEQRSDVVLQIWEEEGLGRASEWSGVEVSIGLVKERRRGAVRRHDTQLIRPTNNDNDMSHAEGSGRPKG